MDKRVRQRVAREAAVLPPLPETASKLAVELHQRADAMLRVRLENIEVYVNNLMDRMIAEVLERALKPVLDERIRKIVDAGVTRLLLQEEIERQLRETVASPQVLEEVGQVIKERLGTHIWHCADEYAKQIAPTRAEIIAKDALDELQRYYGSSGILAADGERK